MVDKLKEHLYSARIALAGGQEFNDLEPWRKLFVQFGGGAEQVQLAGIRSLHDFPACPSQEKLQLWFAEWQHIQTQRGQNMPDNHRFARFMKSLHDSVSSDTRMRNIRQLQPAIHFVLADLYRYRDQQLSRVNDKLRSDQLPQGMRNPIHALQIAEPKPDAEPSSLDVLAQNVKSLTGQIFALKQQQGTFRPTGRGGDRRRPRGDRRQGSGLARPNPKFNGCWHCGGTVAGCAGVRTKCPDVLRMLKDNDGKRPPAYNGKYEQSLKTVSSRTTSDDQLREHPETAAAPQAISSQHVLPLSNLDLQQLQRLIDAVHSRDLLSFHPQPTATTATTMTNSK